MVDYAPDREAGEAAEPGQDAGTREGSPDPPSRRSTRQDDSDTDFQADSDIESAAGEPVDDDVDPEELRNEAATRKSKLTGKKKISPKSSPRKVTPKKKRSPPRKKVAKVESTPTKLKGKTVRKAKRTPKKVATPKNKALTPKTDRKMTAASASPMRKSAPSKAGGATLDKKGGQSLTTASTADGVKTLFPTSNVIDLTLDDDTDEAPDYLPLKRFATKSAHAAQPAE